MLFYIALAVFGLLTIFYSVFSTLMIVWLHGQLRAKDREAAELRGALRLFEDVRQAVGYLAAAYNDLAASNGNLISTHQVLVEHARSLCAQTERVLTMVERDDGDTSDKILLTRFRPDLDSISRN
jgi:hypothetical protein